MLEALLRSASSASCSLMRSPRARMAAIASSASPPAFLTVAISSLARLRSARMLSTSVSSGGAAPPPRGTRRATTWRRRPAVPAPCGPRRGSSAPSSRRASYLLGVGVAVAARPWYRTAARRRPHARGRRAATAAGPCYPAGTEQARTQRVTEGAAHARGRLQSCQPRDRALALVAGARLRARRSAARRTRPASPAAGRRPAPRRASPSEPVARRPSPPRCRRRPSSSATAVTVSGTLTPAAADQEVVVTLDGVDGRTGAHRRDGRLHAHVHAAAAAGTWSRA